MPQTFSLDLRGKSCDEFMVEISKVLVAMKPGDVLSLIADQDRILCTHQLLKNAPRYLFKGDVVGDHAEITIRRVR
ncbi:sulfurtransferase TusA family protein [Metallosphaera javensis (ex Sakai et al. 2022)]|uniref:sulfurtransferase TusA family protein n=1 Tax=Metallosphaera javensis (ex Sakai et al. 2022) TaxID=2775498 RepID=UPI0025853A0B|nr:MAG: tusA-domain-containg protein Saci_0194 [Metallosphaera javensis (ex Sakai et al. 2022)]